MKINHISHKILAVVAVIALSLWLTGCEGRAKIAELNDNPAAPHNPASQHVDVLLQSRAVGKSSLEFLLLVDNYYSDNLDDLLSLEDCGVTYRQSSESEYSNRNITGELSGNYTYITIKNLEYGREYIVTPFVINDYPYHTYYGKPVTVRTKSY